jgi:hypothetical protein
VALDLTSAADADRVDGSPLVSVFPFLEPGFGREPKTPLLGHDLTLSDCENRERVSRTAS